MATYIISIMCFRLWYTQDKKCDTLNIKNVVEHYLYINLNVHNLKLFIEVLLNTSIKSILC